MLEVQEELMEHQVSEINVSLATMKKVNKEAPYIEQILNQMKIISVLFACLIAVLTLTRYMIQHVNIGAIAGA